MKALFKWTLGGLFAALVALAVTWTAAFLVTDARLDTALAAIPAESQGTLAHLPTWNHLHPDENGAPLFVAAFALHGAWDREQGPNMERVLSGGWRALPEVRQTSLRTWLESKKAAFDLAAQAAERPECRYTRAWAEDPWNLPTPEAGGVVYLGRSLIVRASMQVADGDFADARNSIRLAFSVADSLRDEPPRDMMALRLGLHSQILKHLLHLIPAVTGPECDEWKRVLPSPAAFDGALERACQWDLRVTADLLSGPMTRFWRAWSDRNPNRSRRRTVPFWMSDPIAKWDGMGAIKDLRHELETIRMPYREARTELNRMWEEDHERSRGLHPVRRSFVVPSPYYMDQIQMNRSLIALIRTGLDWEKVRVETGTYPPQCESLDPCTSAPFLLEAGPQRLTSVTLRGPRFEQRHSWNLRLK